MIRYTLFHNQDAMFMRVGTPEDTYIMGYSGRLYTTEGKISHILEHIFERHNVDDRPDGKFRPSLSVGDAVVLMMDDHIGEPYVYSVAVFGFNEWREDERDHRETVKTVAEGGAREDIGHKFDD